MLLWRSFSLLALSWLADTPTCSQDDEFGAEMLRGPSDLEPRCLLDASKMLQDGQLEANLASKSL